MPRPFTVASALSPLLCAAVCFLWAESENLARDDSIAWRDHTTWMIQSKDSRVWLERWEIADPVPIQRNTDLWWSLRGTTNPPYQPNSPFEVGYTPRPLSQYLGFELNSAPHNPFRQRFGGQDMLAIPDWSIVALTAILPVAWIIAVLRRRRRGRKGLCLNCSYDLTGNVSGVCPECGTACG